MRAIRLLMAFGSFWIAGLVAILVMSDPGTMSNPMALTGIPLLATVGLLVGPITFVVGLWGLTHGGYGCDGMIIGATLIGVINLGMSLMGIDANWQKVVKGVVLLGAVVFEIMSNRKKAAANK